MDKEEEALQATYAAQRELTRHRDECWTCGHECSALRYCPTGKELRKKRDAAQDRYYEVRREAVR